MGRQRNSKSLWVKQPDLPSPWRSRGGLGALLFLGLVAAGTLVVAPYFIESQVQEQVGLRLAGVGVEVIQTRASGQQVMVVARPPKSWGEHSATKIKAIAATTQCETWAGAHRCPLEVEVVMPVAEVTTKGALAVNEGAKPSTPSTPSSRPGHGALPNPPKGRAPSAAKPAKPAKPAPPDHAKAAPRPSPAVAAQKAQALARQACEQEVRATLSETSILFRSASSRILKQSNELLDRLALKIQSCPGQVRIEGHSDNVGKFSTNQWLSKARAHAVRRALLRRGLAASRLEAIGKGDTQPIADNGTASGRAKNRRIEFLFLAPLPSTKESIAP